ncbi:hypothetical protein TcCL_NonESM10272 [Trypanosoma cruzi]|nr:hypothetical protein TcCL_NonESM10272 [Trypanosoma cruzi]
MAVPASFATKVLEFSNPPHCLSHSLSVCGTPVSPPYGGNAPGMFLVGSGFPSSGLGGLLLSLLSSPVAVTHTERAPTTPVTRASEPSSIHNAATKFPAIPPSMGHGAQLNAATRGAPHPQERRLGLRTPSPSSSFSSWPRKTTTAATRNCQHAPQKEHSYPLQCASCVCGCVCLQKHKAKE